MNTQKSSKPIQARPKSASSKQGTRRTRSSANNNNNNNKMNNNPNRTQDAPAARGRSMAVRKPQTSSRAGVTTIHHSEMIYSVPANGGDPFTIAQPNGFALNPGLTTTFPWLSQQAAGFEHYQIRDMSVEYVPLAASSTNGAVLLIIDYDSADAPPIDQQAAGTYQDSVQTNVWCGAVCKLNPASLHVGGNKKFTRSGPQPNNDIKTYDAGRLFFAVIGVPGTSVVGNVWVRYTVDFYTPQSQSLVAPTPTRMSSWSLIGSQALPVAADIPLKLFSGTTFNPLLTKSNGAGDTLTIPIGSYWFIYHFFVNGFANLTGHDWIQACAINSPDGQFFFTQGNVSSGEGCSSIEITGQGLITVGRRNATLQVTLTTVIAGGVLVNGRFSLLAI